MPGRSVTRANVAISRLLVPTRRSTRSLTVAVPLGIPIATRRPEWRALRRASRRRADRPVSSSRRALRAEGAGAVVAPPGARVPLPVSGTRCGVPAASLVRSSCALRVPAAAGRNFMAIVHVSPGPTAAVQRLLVIANSAALGPEIAAPEMFSDRGPAFLIVTTFSGVVVLTFWLRKFTMGGEALR